MNYKKTYQEVVEESEIDLLPYQRAHLKDQSDRKSFRGARRVGKTTTALMEAVLKARRGEVVDFITPRMAQCRLAEENSPVDVDGVRFNTALSMDYLRVDHIVVDEVEHVDWLKIYDHRIRNNSRLRSISIYGTPLPDSIFAFAESSAGWSNRHVSMAQSDLISDAGMKDMARSTAEGQEVTEIDGNY